MRSLGGGSEHVTELCHVDAAEPAHFDGVHEVAVVRGLLGGLYKQNTLDSAVARTVRSTPR